jgi:hypothetical protein
MAMSVGITQIVSVVMAMSVGITQIVSVLAVILQLSNSSNTATKLTQ